jgi:hypothetical protein
VRGDARTDLQRTIASAIVAASQPADLLLIPDGLQELYLPYYHDRAYFLSVNGLMTSHHTWAESCTARNTQIARNCNKLVRPSSRRLIFLTPSLVMQKRFHIAPDAVQSCIAPILPDFTLLHLTANIP